MHIYFPGMKRKSLLFVMVMIYISAYPQELIVSGEVTDAKTLQPISNVQVFNSQSKTGTTTGKDGRFFLKIVSKKDVVLMFLHVSYHSLEKTYRPGKTYQQQTIRLEPKTEQLKEIEIMGVSVKNKPYRTENIDIHTVQKSNLQGVGDLLRNVANISGVRKGALGIDPVLRGFKYSQLNVQINGGQTNHSGLKAKLGVTGGSRKVTYKVSGSWKKYGDYKDGNGNWVPASLQQQAYTGNLGFKIAKKHVVYAEADIEQGKDVDFPALPMDERKDDTKIFSLNYLGNNLGATVNFIRFKAYYSDVHHEMDNKNRPFSDTIVAVSKIHASTLGGKLGVNINVGKARLEVGSDYENIKKDGERKKFLIMQAMLPQKKEDLWHNAQVNNLGLFTEYNHPGIAIDWVVAARLDFNTAFSDPLRRNNMGGDAVYFNDSTTSKYLNISFSGGLTWHMSKQNDFVVSLGRGARSPDITERFIILLPIGYDPYDYLGNPQLKPEINHELDIGYRYNGRNIIGTNYPLYEPGRIFYANLIFNL